MSIPSSVTIAGQEVKLGKPASLCLRQEVVSVVYNAAGKPTALRALAAALGAAWASPAGKPKADYARHGYDALAYGGAVLDELLLRRVPVEDIVTGGNAAFTLLLDGLLSGGEVAAHEDFLEASEGDSTTPSSTSKVPSTSGSAGSRAKSRRSKQG